jgi:hypothetical protein
MLSAAFGGVYLSGQFGPSWPRDVLEHAPDGRRVSLGFGAKSGAFVGDVVGVGFAGDFYWSRSTEDSTYDVPDDLDSTRLIERTVEKSAKKWFMFPVSMFLSIDPLFGLPVRPAFTAQLGLNNMVYVNRAYEDGEKKKTSDTGYYYGLYGKLSLDALIALGSDQVSFYVGPSYMFSRPRRRVRDTDNEYTYKPMHGAGLQAGLALTL